MKKPKLLILFTSFLLMITAHCFSWPVPHTGQTKCYDGNREIPCPQRGEAYYGQDAQYVINKRSYTKLDEYGNQLPNSASHWVMVRDNVTGLIWEVKTSDTSIHGKERKFTWEEAQTSFIKKLNRMRFGGFSDWRIPEIKELASISNKGKYNPAIDTGLFPNTMSAFYWSSTSGARKPTVAWGVDFYYGGGNDYAKSSMYYVRAVRSGQ